MSFEEFSDCYMKAVQGRLRSYPRIVEVFDRYRRYFAGRSIDSIRRKDIADYIEWRRKQVGSNNTVNVDLATLSAAINYARKNWEWEIPNPVTGQLLRTPEGRLRYLTREEAHDLLDAAKQSRKAPHLLPFILLALNTGCRKNEMLGLPWADVDLKAKRFTLEGHRTKSGKRRIIPINQAAYDALMTRRLFADRNCPTTPWVFCKKSGERITDIDKAFNNARKLAKLEDFRIHDLRHTFASWLVMGEVPLIHVRDLLGHATIRMTERYAHLAQDSLIKAVAVLDRTK
jgi:integrase